MTNCFIFFWTVRLFLLVRSSTTHQSADDFIEQVFDQSNTTISVTEGQTIYLDCKVLLRGEKTVAWVRQNNGVIQLITYGHASFHDDRRFSLSYEPPGNWRLRLVAVNRKDSGSYECQISSDPPLKKTIQLVVTEPSILITDSTGARVGPELMVKEGSSVALRCVLELASIYNKNLPFWKFNGHPISHSVENIMIEEEKEGSGIIFWLHILKAHQENEGYYACATRHSRGESVKINVLTDKVASPMTERKDIGTANKSTEISLRSSVLIIMAIIYHNSLINV